MSKVAWSFGLCEAPHDKSYQYANATRLPAQQIIQPATNNHVGTFNQQRTLSTGLLHPQAQISSTWKGKQATSVRS